MFKDLLAKFGHGGAKVDLRLNQSAYELGSEITGDIVVTGGAVEQGLSGIEVEFYIEFYIKEQLVNHRLYYFPIHFSEEIKPGEQKVFPFSYRLPNDYLLSSSTVRYYFVTKLAIDKAVDASDRDYIQVIPPQRLQRVIDAFTALNFYEKSSSRKFDGKGQEFEFAPTGIFRDQVEEVEFIAALQEDGISLLLEVDAYAFLGEKEIKRHVWLDNSLLDDVPALASHLQNTIQDMLDHPLDSYHNYSFQHGGSSSYSSGASVGKMAAAAAIGAFAGGLIASELLNDDDEEDTVADAMEGFFEDSDEEADLFEVDGFDDFFEDD